MIYRKLFYVNIYERYKLLKTVRFFGPPCIYLVKLLLFRPPDIRVGGFIFYHRFVLSSFFFFFRYLISELTERNSTISGNMVRSMCNLKMHVQCLPLPIGGPKTTFLGRLRNLMVNLTDYIFGMKHDIHKRTSALQTTRGLLHHTKTTWTLVHKQLQIGGEFSSTLRKFCIPLHCQASQTEVSKRNSTKLCQTVDGRWR